MHSYLFLFSFTVIRLLSIIHPCVSTTQNDLTHDDSSSSSSIKPLKRLRRTANEAIAKSDNDTSLRLLKKRGNEVDPAILIEIPDPYMDEHQDKHQEDIRNIGAYYDFIDQYEKETEEKNNDKVAFNEKTKHYSLQDTNDHEDLSPAHWSIGEWYFFSAGMVFVGFLFLVLSQEA
mmetsp:Transcript_5684/g.6379  ORF Transcript_5684/g.6379 Transcript_5684/m.6379 type:complete len:175 (-) Transcript_5684:369-893(-)